MNPVTNRVYVIGQDYNSNDLFLHEIDGAARTVVANVRLAQRDQSPGAIAIDTSANKIYTTAVPDGVSNSGEGWLMVIDGTSRAVTTVAPPQSQPLAYPDLEFDQAHHRLYIASNNGIGSFGGYYDVNTGSYASAFSTGVNAALAFDATRTRLYVTTIPAGSSDAGVQTHALEEEKGRSLNISTRLQILGGDNILVGGFIITGPSYYTKHVLIRGLGPSVADAGVAGVLTDPLLELHSGPDATTNDNWKQGDVNQIPAGFAPKYDSESVIVADLAPGAYTAVVKGAHGETGIGLAEIYDLDTGRNTKLANISTRGLVQGGDNVLIGGFIVGAGDSPTVLIRAIGPSLVDAGIQNAMADPVLELHDSNGNTRFNDNWADTQAVEINDTGIPPKKDKESAILAQLAPGAYTAVVRGKNDTTGTAVVEVYSLN